MQRDGWYVLPASEELVFREDTAGMWEELVEKACGSRTDSDYSTACSVKIVRPLLARAKGVYTFN